MGKVEHGRVRTRLGARTATVVAVASVGQCRVTTGTPFLVIPTVVDADVPSNALAPATFWACS